MRATGREVDVDKGDRDAHDPSVPNSVSVTVVVVTFALATPVAVNAEEEVVTEEQVLAAPEQTRLLSWPRPPIVGRDQRLWLSGGEPRRRERVVVRGVDQWQEQALAFAAAAAMAWDDTSGYGAVEASSAAASALLAPVAGSSWDDTSGYGAVEANRAEIALDGALAAC